MYERNQPRSIFSYPPHFLLNNPNFLLSISAALHPTHRRTWVATCPPKEEERVDVVRGEVSRGLGGETRIVVGGFGISPWVRIRVPFLAVRCPICAAPHASFPDVTLDAIVPDPGSHFCRQSRRRRGSCGRTHSRWCRGEARQTTRGTRRVPDVVFRPNTSQVPASAVREGREGVHC